MSGHKGFIQDEDEVLATGTTLTLVQLVAGTNHPILILGFGVGFDSVDASDEPIRVRLQIQTSAGTSVAGTIVQRDRQTSATFDTTARINFTAEPNKTDHYPTRLVHPASGGWEIVFPKDQQIVVASAERIGLEVVSGVLAASLDDVSGWIDFDE